MMMISFRSQPIHKRLKLNIWPLELNKKPKVIWSDKRLPMKLKVKLNLTKNGSGKTSIVYFFQLKRLDENYCNFKHYQLLSNQLVSHVLKHNHELKLLKSRVKQQLNKVI